jgi:serine/threonine protein kinase/tetratricopeptide (TPR) repeat protein
LRTALGSDSPEVEDFDELLASVNIPDRDWQLGNYRILEEIGRGGMGVIYRARHAPSRRIVALKRVLNYHGDSQDTLARFQREARAAASLDHPNILPIYDVGATDDGLPFFSMKFAAGGSLLDSKESFRGKLRRSAKLISTVARAVDYAHSREILHRDLKPGNILLDARCEPMVSDFGLATWLDPAGDLTQTLTVFGTPGYIAPEQSENAGAELTVAADVYSLGAILFELLSGRPPFLGEHALAVLRQAAENDAPKLRSIVPKASRDLETICARCLERDPNLRYASAAALAEDLDRWLEGCPIAARPISPPARFYRWARRNPLLATSLAICLCFAALFGTRQVQGWKLKNKIREGELARNSITVFQCLDLDSANSKPGWTRALADALQTELSSIGTARVVPTDMIGSSTKAPSRKFQTRTALFGTRRSTDHGVEISVQLVSPDGDLLLDQIVDLGVGSDLKPVAHSLAARFLAVLTTDDWSTLIAAKSDPGMLNEQARELITAGRELVFRRNVRDLNSAISCFQKAIELEPRSALAHAYLASAAATRTYYFTDANLLVSATREVRDASAMAPTSAEVMRVLSGVKYQQGQVREALEDALRAIEIGPPNARSLGMAGMLSRELGRPDQGLRWYELAKRFDPHPGEYDYGMGDCWALLGDYEKARICYRRASDLHPDRLDGLLGMSHLSLLNSDFAQARRLCRQSTQLDPDSVENAQLAAQIEFFARNFTEAEKTYTDLNRKDPAGGGGFYADISYKSALGRIGLDKKNDHPGKILLQQCLAAELERLKSVPDDRDTLYRVAAIESSLGQTDSAIAHLEAAVTNGWLDYRSLSLDPRFDGIGNDTRFQAILGRVKLKTESIRKQIDPSF